MDTSAGTIGWYGYGLAGMTDVREVADGNIRDGCGGEVEGAAVNYLDA